MKTTVKLLGAVLMILATNYLWAQQKVDSTERKFQLTFITPIGTNGVESGNIVNKLSINILAGYNGGLNGAEFGVFANILKGDMRGAQLAGYANVNLKTGTGFQGSGFLNYNQTEFSGTQLSGCSNIVLANSRGFQGTGFVNVVKGNFKGVQLAGFTNVVTDSIDGFQGSGFANYSKSNTRGQLSGFANFNFSDTKGPQICGFSNINTGDLNGAQISGFANVNTKSLKGAQISGFFNYTKVLKGLQLGAFNYVDSLEKGVAVGLLSFVRNGYHTFEISGNESMYGVLSYRTGTRSFYNILAVGASVRNEKIYWGFGYGVGTIVPVKGRVDLNFEAICFHINEDEWDSDQLNLHNRINALVSIRLTNNLTVFGGPSWNVLVSDITDDNGNIIKSDYAPWHVFNKTYNDKTNVKMYPGFSAGIRF
ncbi:MAG: hypothetical protein AB7S48_07690 [Bacteroidales bacterium]